MSSGSYALSHYSLSGSGSGEEEESLTIDYGTSGATSFSDLPAEFSDVSDHEVTDKERKALQKVFFALGDDKWMEAIDIKEHKHGEMVYDECLHGGNNGKSEPGFLQSTRNAMDYVGSILGEKTTLEHWLECHKIMCSHFVDYKTTNTDHHDIEGKMRVHYWKNVATYNASHWDKATVEYITGMRPKIVELRKIRRKGGGWGSDPYGTPPLLSSTYGSGSVAKEGGIRLWFSAMKRKRRRRYFNFYRDEMYHNLRHAKDDNDRLRAVVRFHQVLQWLHIAMDGTQRVCMVFLNKHLTEAGFHPVFLHHPHYADVSSLDKWTEATKHGLRAWERGMKKTGHKWPLEKPEKGTKKGKKPRQVWDDFKDRKPSNPKFNPEHFRFAS